METKVNFLHNPLHYLLFTIPDISVIMLFRPLCIRPDITIYLFYPSLVLYLPTTKNSTNQM